MYLKNIYKTSNQWNIPLPSASKRRAYYIVGIQFYKTAPKRMMYQMIEWIQSYITSLPPSSTTTPASSPNPHT